MPGDGTAPRYNVAGRYGLSGNGLRNENRGQQREWPKLSKSVGGTAQRDELEEAAAGPVRGEEEGIIALKDDYLGLFVRSDRDDVIFLHVPFIVEFVGEFID